MPARVPFLITDQPSRSSARTSALPETTGCRGLGRFHAKAEGAGPLPSHGMQWLARAILRVAMSEENVELVRDAYEAWNRDDLDWFIARIAPDYEMWPIPDFLDLEEVYRGPEGWRDFWTTWRDAWEDIALRVERIEDVGEGVLGMVTFDGKGRGSGVEVSLNVGHIFKLRDGMFVRFDAFPSWDEALKAAGRE